MANEMFTTRSGQQIPVSEYHILPDSMISIMRLKEDFEARKEYLSLHGVMLDIIDKGIRQIRNQWKNGDLSKNRRDFSKAVAAYMVNPAKYAKEISDLAVRHGLVAGTAVELSDADPEPELEVVPDPAPQPEEMTLQELEQATAPETANAA